MNIMRREGDSYMAEPMWPADHVIATGRMALASGNLELALRCFEIAVQVMKQEVSRAY